MPVTSDNNSSRGASSAKGVYHDTPGAKGISGGDACDHGASASGDQAVSTVAAEGENMQPSGGNNSGVNLDGEAQADDAFGGLDAEEYEYMKDMMNAMEDGLEDQVAEGDTGIPREESTRSAGEGETDESNEVGLDEEEYPMAMMNEEDGSEEEEGELQEDHEQVLANRHVGGPSAFAANLGQNILDACSSVTSAVREYYRMSQSDQLQVWDDLTGYQAQRRVFVHGEELPDYREQFEPQHMVEAALKQLPQELQRMPSSHNHAALDLALEKHPTYLLAPDFLLKFLRTEKFDVFATAIRMCRHFEVKLDIFGEEALGREITLDDLDEDDMAALKSGYIQVLQSKDHSHRPVIFYYKAVSSECYKERENILRAFWYMTNKLGESEEVQKLGVSNLVYNNGGFPRQGMDYEKSRRLSYAFQAIPVRYNTFYVCLDDTPWLTVVETFAVLITRYLRVRLRMLRGTHDEVVEKLKALGMPVQALPVNSDSELILDAHLAWIDKLRLSEQTAKPVRSVPVIEPYADYGSHTQVSDSTAAEFGRGGPRRRLDATPYQTMG